MFAFAPLALAAVAHAAPPADDAAATAELRVADAAPARAHAVTLHVLNLNAFGPGLLYEHRLDGADALVAGLGLGLGFTDEGLDSGVASLGLGYRRTVLGTQASGLFFGPALSFTANWPGPRTVGPVPELDLGVKHTFPMGLVLEAQGDVAWWNGGAVPGIGLGVGWAF